MLTPKEKREYQALAAKLKGERVKVKGNTVTVGSKELILPPNFPQSSRQNEIF